MDQGKEQRYEMLYRKAKELRKKTKEYLDTRDKHTLSVVKALERDLDTLLTTIAMFDKFDIPTVEEEEWEDEVQNV